MDNTLPAEVRRVLRALAALVGLLIVVGVYGVVTGGPQAHAASPTSPSATHFGFALAAGAIALAATILMSRPRLRFRR